MLYHRKNNQLKRLLYTFFFLMVIALILTNSQKSVYYALNGLNLWFQKMIPSLLPFMILSGVMVRLRLTESFAAILYPILYPIFRVSKNVTYAMIMGFLCGFPMGARVTCDLFQRKMITKQEASYLLSFCNNIGPVYFVGFVLPLIQRKLLAPYLFGMYGLPALYGILMRYTRYRKLDNIVSSFQPSQPTSISVNLMILEQIDDAINTAVQSVLMLGGYMIFFNLLNLIPDALASVNSQLYLLPMLFAPVLEITGGLGMIGDKLPLAALLLLPFGGLSCIAQTYSIINKTDLSIHEYVLHKLAITALTVVYYFAWYFISPETFLL